MNAHSVTISQGAAKRAHLPAARITLDLGLRALLALAIAGAGVSELAGAHAVVRSLDVLGYPMYLMPLLGILKLVAAVVLLLPGRPIWKEWAFAGIAFDVLGASYSFAASQTFLVPDVILAPAYLALTLVTAAVWRRNTRGAHPYAIAAHAERPR